MESLITEETTGEELIATLVRIVSDPARLSCLHDLLGTFCHQGRNVLNSVKLSMYLCRRHDASGPAPTWTQIESSYHEAEQFFDRLQTVCRPMSLTPIRTSLALLFEERCDAWSEAMSARGQRLMLIPPAEPAIGQFDPARLGCGFDGFAGWRAESMREGAAARLAWWAEEGSFRVVWDELGGGVEEPARDSRPTSLALPILARIISAHGGTIDVDHDEGMHLKIRWPLELCTI